MHFTHYALRICTGFASDLDTQSAERLSVYLGKHNCRMGLAAIETWQLPQSLGTTLIAQTQNRQCHQHLISMQTRVMTLQVRNLGVLDRLYQLV